jgi:Protein of unknown function (DUF4238)
MADILRAKAETGGFVTTDHPVCVHKPGAPVNYGQLYAPGFGLADLDILFPLSSLVCLIGRREGEEDVIEVGLHGVANVNATVMGFALRQTYSTDDQFYYTRSPHEPIGRGFTLLKDPIFFLVRRSVKRGFAETMLGKEDSPLLVHRLSLPNDRFWPRRSRKD